MTDRDYVSDFLVHWTGRNKSDETAAQILKTICEESVLRLTHCPRYVQGDLKPYASMVCFTDIPLKVSSEHCGRFGRCGIGFRKDAMIAYGANPVFYTTSRHLARIRHLEALLARMKDFEKDREWREELEQYRFTEDETIALTEITDFHQEYSYKNDDNTPYVTYYQREWRLPFSSLPFAGAGKSHESGMSSFYIRDGESYPIFKFGSSDVAFLVVPRAFQGIVSDLVQRTGWEIRVFEDEVERQDSRFHDVLRRILRLPRQGR